MKEPARCVFTFSDKLLIIMKRSVFIPTAHSDWTACAVCVEWTEADDWDILALPHAG